MSREEQDQSGCCPEDKGRVRKLGEEVSMWLVVRVREDGGWAQGRCSGVQKWTDL